MAFTTVDEYLQLITSEHIGQPRYTAFLSVFLEGQVDLMNMLATLPGKFDPEYAEGEQLDWVGIRVGISRDIPVPLEGVYFAWDTDFVGWDEGVWQGPWDPDDGIVRLSDEAYRTLIMAKIASNSWDGSAPSAYEVWAIAFGEGMITMTDHQNMSIDIEWVGPPPDAVTKSLLEKGYFNLKPAGVAVQNIFLRLADGTRIQLNK